MKTRVKIGAEEKILSAAKASFLKYGMQGARMQEIADKAGINKALLHYYFRSKEKLFDRIFEEALSEFLPKLQFWEEDKIPFKEKLSLHIDNYIEFLSKYPMIPLFVIKEMSVDPEKFHQRMIAKKKSRGPKLLESVEKEMKAGRIKKMDPKLFFIHLHSLCAYPFVGEVFFKQVMKIGEKEWNEYRKVKIKDSVKKFMLNAIKK